MNKSNDDNNANFKIEGNEWWVQHYTRSFEQQTILCNQIVKHIPTKLQYIEICFPERRKQSKVLDFRIRYPRRNYRSYMDHC